MGLSRAAAYAQINAVVHARYSDCLSGNTLRNLAKSDTLSAFISALDDTPYRPYLELPSTDLTPRRVVYQFRLLLAHVYDKLIRMTPHASRPLLIMLWQGYEVDNLKAILRGIENQASWEQVLFLLSPMNRYNLLNIDTLHEILESNQISAAIQQLEKTPYFYPLSYALSRYQEENTLFPLEIALDLNYRRRLWRCIDRLGGEDHDQALRLVGRLLDRDNLLWALRYRIYHHLSQEEIINYTISRGYLVQDVDIMNIARGRSISEVLQRLFPNNTDIQALHSSIPDDSSISNGFDDGWLLKLENILTADIHAQCRKTFLFSPFHIGIPLSYVLMVEMEIRTLTAIVEATAIKEAIPEIATIDMGEASPALRLQDKSINSILESYVQITTND
ncbi:MAG: V-type ATPase subunit [Anaerolineae bacterium]|nr:V-type ATPase subunit [Anaerolineae bacterium]